MVKFEETELKDKKNYVELGKYIINTKFLHNNILLLKYKSYGPAKIKRQTISDDMMNILIYLLETGTIDYEALRELSESENNLFKDIMIKTGLFQTLKYKYASTREQIGDVIEQYEILKGEIEAGNDNPDIPKQIKKVLKKLRNYGKIDEEEYQEIVEGL